MLARWFLPLLPSTVRFDNRLSLSWSNPQNLVYAQLFAASRNLPPCQPGCPAACAKGQRGWVWCWCSRGFLWGPSGKAIRYNGFGCRRDDRTVARHSPQDGGLLQPQLRRG